jgi:anaerobic ribonucleoside-triphosphate reductase activating protein
MLNGDGIRVVLWVSGCIHHCEGCQNPVTWNPNDGVDFGNSALIEILNELSKEHISGITFSGGDPLHPKNRLEVAIIINIIKQHFPKKTVWIYTGFTWEEIMQDAKMFVAIKHADVLVDGRFDKTLTSKNFCWVGSSNQRVIDVQKSIKKGKVVLHESN